MTRRASFGQSCITTSFLERRKMTCLQFSYDCKNLVLVVSSVDTLCPDNNLRVWILMSHKVSCRYLTLSLICGMHYNHIDMCKLSGNYVLKNVEIVAIELRRVFYQILVSCFAHSLTTYGIVMKLNGVLDHHKTVSIINLMSILVSNVHRQQAARY